MDGRIEKALSGFYYVNTGDRTVRCRARGKFRREALSPLVGDCVSFRDLGGGEGVIEEIAPRRSVFERPAVANVDQMVIVVSNAIPRSDPYLIDRMCAFAALKQCRVLVCINKCDLDAAAHLYESYTRAGYECYRVSAETGEGIEALRNAIVGKLSVFTGNSGVGKSSILNALAPDFSVRVGEVSRALGRGKHTTRHVELYRLSCGAEIIDTPGFSSFGEPSLALKEALADCFPDFAPYIANCRFVGCSHTSEKGCAVLQALSEGRIVPSRHASYCRLHEELKGLRQWQESGKDGIQKNQNIHKKL